MDIDKFLDGELNEFSSAPAPSSSNKEAPSPSSVPKPAPAQFSDSNLDESIAHMQKLWGHIEEAQFSWDEVSEQELGNLITDVDKKLQDLHKEFLQKKTHLLEAMNQSQVALRSNQYEKALESYQKAKDIFDSMPSLFFDEREPLEKQLFRLHAHIELQKPATIKKHAGDLTKAHDLLQKACDSFDHQDIGLAKKNYLAALSAFKSLAPEVLVQHSDMGKKLLLLYKHLSIRTQISTLHEKLQSQLQQQAPEPPLPPGAPAQAPAAQAQPAAPVMNQKVPPAPMNAQPMQPQSSPPQPSLENKANESSNAHAHRLVKGILKSKMKGVDKDMKKGYFASAKEELAKILRFDPHNKKANELMDKMPK